MKRILALIAITCVLLSSACRSAELWSVRNAEQARERARGLLARAGGHREEARQYGFLIQKTELDVKAHQSVIDKLTAERLELAEQIELLRSKKLAASGEKAQALGKTIATYRDKKGVTEAQIDDKRTRMGILEEQLYHWRGLREACFWHAEQQEAKAAELEAYARELSQR